MKLKFKLAWQTYRVGDVIEPPAMLRNWLLNNKYCVPEEMQMRETVNVSRADVGKSVLSLPRRGRPPNKVA